MFKILSLSLCLRVLVVNPSLTVQFRLARYE
jgi:hypothetical protein